MICILKMTGADVTGWIIAADIPEARRKAQRSDNELAGILYRMEFTPTSGKHQLPGGYLLLVE